MSPATSPEGAPDLTKDNPTPSSSSPPVRRRRLGRRCSHCTGLFFGTSDVFHEYIASCAAYTGMEAEKEMASGQDEDTMDLM